MRRFMNAGLPLLWLALPVLIAASGAPWPQWRGPDRTGSSAGAPWPADFTGFRQLWRVDLAQGYPGPIITDKLVFTVETAKGDTEIVRALDRASGKERWRASWPGKISVPFYAKRNGDWIRSTPSFDGRALYVCGMEEVLVALDASSGKELWRVDFPKRFQTPKPDFGCASSPLIDGNAIYLQAADSFVKLDRKTGQTIWRALEVKHNVFESGAFSSPFIATLAGKRQILVQTRTHLTGLDPSSGKVHWSQEVPNFRGMNILTPSVWGDSVFTSSYRNDTYMYKVEPSDGGLSVRELWKNKAKGYMSSPTIIAGHAYLHLANQRFTCIDLATGETKWTTEPFGMYWSMVSRGDRILALDERGQIHLIRANPERFELLASMEVAETSAWAHLAVAPGKSGEEIYVRDLKGITAFGWSGPPQTSTAAPASGRAKT